MQLTAGVSVDLLVQALAVIAQPPPHGMELGTMHLLSAASVLTQDLIKHNSMHTCNTANTANLKHLLW
jgi:hypothetical protein